MGKPNRKASNYLDSKTIEDIKKSILFLRKSGMDSDDQIFDKIRLDFDVSITAIKNISGQLPIPSQLASGVSNLSGIAAFGYVLIKCDTGYENEIISKLIKLSKVSEARGVFGEYDIFVKLDAKSEEKIEEAIAKIRKIPHITFTNTLTSIPSQGGR
jgi:DNA-binding Lrp family transcriptional regulator